jgi:predicted permease
MLGTAATLGRTFEASEDRLGASPVVVLSHEFWQRRFGATASVLGTTINLSGLTYTVIGVLPPGFRFYGRTDVYLPIGQWEAPNYRNRNFHSGTYVLGRLRPGVTLEQARMDMASIARHLAELYPKSNTGLGVNLKLVRENILGDIRPALMVLLGAVSFVLLIACANVANLLLARSTSRRREFAIRAALGAGRGRMIRQLLTEGVTLATGGGVLGVFLATWGTQALLATVPEGLPRLDEVHTDGRVLAFALGASLLTGVLFGLVPALAGSRDDMQESLREGGRGLVGGRHRLQDAFVVCEVALALVLLMAAGLMIRTVWRLSRVDPGFDPHHVLMMYVAQPSSLVGNAQGIRAFLRQLLNNVHSVPGVEGAALNLTSSPLSGGNSTLPFWVEGRPRPPSHDQMTWALTYATSGDYLRVMRIPLLRGRDLTEGDNEMTSPVVLIDEVMARGLFPKQDPIGQHLNIEWVGKKVEIVGIAGHVAHWGLDSDATARIRFQMYLPYSQIPDSFWPLLAASDLLVRTSGEPSALAASIRRAVVGTGVGSPVFDIRTMDETLSGSIAYRRFLRLLLMVFAVLALVLADVGIYGLVSYSVGQRVHEIGIRMALGAGRRQVLRLVVGQGMRRVLVGVSLGLLAALALARLMAKVLFGIRPSDPWTLVAVSVLLCGVALAASLIPARRVAKLDPMVALRYE